jgi:hypothetical protein
VILEKRPKSIETQAQSPFVFEQLEAAIWVRLRRFGTLKTMKLEYHLDQSVPVVPRGYQFVLFPMRYPSGRSSRYPGGYVRPCSIDPP